LLRCGARLAMHPSMAIHEAYRRGDLPALEELLGNPPDFPNSRGPRGAGEVILEYAIYWSPLAFIGALLRLGADPNYASEGGFPSLIAALSTDRADRSQLLELLLAHGASVRQRGISGWTPLHYAATRNDAPAIELLLAHGADASATTGIDDSPTPLEEAERLGHAQAAAALRKFPPR
jgi:uncharacterized protein